MEQNDMIIKDANQLKKLKRSTKSRKASVSERWNGAEIPWSEMTSGQKIGVVLEVVTGLLALSLFILMFTDLFQSLSQQPKK